MGFGDETIFPFPSRMWILVLQGKARGTHRRHCPETGTWVGLGIGHRQVGLKLKQEKCQQTPACVSAESLEDAHLGLGPKYH